MEHANLSCTVREATAADLLGIVRLLERSPSFQASNLSERQRVAWHRMMANRELTVYVAEANDAAVGTASLLLMPHITYDCHPTAFIEAVVVEAAHRRRGVGRAVMKRILDDARAASCRKVQLLSHKRHADDGAHDFYRALGFEPEAKGFRLYLPT